MQDEMTSPALEDLTMPEFRKTTLLLDTATTAPPDSRQHASLVDITTSLRYHDATEGSQALANNAEFEQSRKGSADSGGIYVTSFPNYFNHSEAIALL